MKLLSIDSNAKLAKTNKVVGDNHLYAGLSLMPDDILCPGAKAAGCMVKCLKSAGRGRFSNVSKARTAKSAMFHNNPMQFRYWLVKDLEALAKYIADYVMEEQSRGNIEVDKYMIMDAMSAYIGGAR